jgi:hypothetical protein
LTNGKSSLPSTLIIARSVFGSVLASAVSETPAPRASSGSR